MGAITLPNFRTTADVTMNTRLKDGGVSIDWAGLTDIKAWLYSDAQKAIAGRCDVTISEADSTKLVCEYSASKPQYLGVQRLIVQATYMGRTKTYDKPVFNFVRRTADQAGAQITMDDPEVDVEIVVEDVSSSILDEATAAALAAAEHAEHAASLVPLQVLQDCEEATRVALTAASKAPRIGQNGNWWTWDAEHEQYVDSGQVARGPRGNGIASWSVAESQEDDGENVVTVTFNDGEVETFTVKNGKTGNGIASIVQTVVSQEDAGTNEITVTMTDGTVVTFNVKNGSKGQPGAAQAAYKRVETLPEPSAATMDKIYLTPSGTADVYNMSYTDFDGTNYSWVALGTTAIQLSDYATKTEFDELSQKVDEKIDGQDANYLENKAVTQEDRIPVSAEGFGCSDFIPYTQGNSVYWKWGADTNYNALCFYDSEKQPISNGYWTATTSGGSRTISASDINRYAPNAAYIRATFQLSYKNVATVTTGDVVWTPVDFVAGLSHRVSSLEQTVETQQGAIEALEETLENIETNVIEGIYDGKAATYENGRLSAGGNVFKDSDAEGWFIPIDFIACQPNDVLTWTSGQNNGQGKYCLCLYNENKEFIEDGYWQPSKQPKTVTITPEYSSARYVRFSFKLKKTDSTDNTTPLLINGESAFTVQGYVPGLTHTDEKASEALEKVNQLLPTDTEHGIIGENYPSEVLVVENQLQAKLSNRFHFIHISDNHGNSFGYAQKYLDYSPAKFLINTGDLVADKFADKDLESFQTIELATEPTKPVFLVLGNHDYSHATSRQAVFNAFIAPTNTHNGTAFDKTYYALDFGTEKVKCVILDMNDGWADEVLPDYGPSGNLTYGKMSQEQINWLASQLQDAITNSLDVVIFIHTPPAQVSRFNRIKEFSDTINLDYARNLTFLPGLIDAFINGGTASFTYDGNSYSFTFATRGHFVSWVCGHEHGDLCGWMEGHDNQFIAVVCRPYRDTSKYSGSYDGDKLGVHWNYCTIDAERKSFSVYRIGQQTTIFGTDRVSFRILYK